MHDVAYLESNGIPTVAIVSDEFKPQLAYQASMLGLEQVRVQWVQQLPLLRIHTTSTCNASHKNRDLLEAGAGRAYECADSETHIILDTDAT